MPPLCKQDQWTLKIQTPKIVKLLHQLINSCTVWTFKKNKYQKMVILNYSFFSSMKYDLTNMWCNAAQCSAEYFKLLICLMIMLFNICC